MKEEDYQPVWLDDQGFEWVYDPAWEGCEYGLEPFDPDNFDPVRARQIREAAPTGNECLNPTEYIGDRGRIRIQLCGEHFRKLKARLRDPTAIDE